MAKTVKELKAAYNKKVEQMRSLQTQITDSGVTDELETQVNELTREADDLKKEIEKTEELQEKLRSVQALRLDPDEKNRSQGQEGKDSEGRELQRMARNFNVGKIITRAANLKVLDGVEKEYSDHYARHIQLNEKDYFIPAALKRDLSGVDATSGGDWGANVYPEIIAGLYPATILDRLGITRIINPKGAVVLRKVANPATGASKKGKTESLDSAGMTTSKITISPSRIGHYETYTDEMVAEAETNASIAALISSELSRGLSVKVELNGITKVLAEAVNGAISANLEWKDLLELMNAIKKNNLMPNAFVGGLDADTYLASKVRSDGAADTKEFLLKDDGNIRRYPFVESNNLGAGNDAALIGGDWSRLVEVNWGRVIRVNPYSLDTEGETRITMAEIVEHGVTHTAAFKKIPNVQPV
ncbi:phage major capsid protein [Limibacter armeniacum]|uniref:phage major capsid protein n=1 Tax=Limibacter armeniacum TaxID=466084 RepID=UPI002FE53DA4